MLDSARDLASRHALLLIVGLGALLRFATLDVQGFWLDEQVTLEVIGEPPGSGTGLIDVLRSVEGSESNPPLYYLLLALWQKVFGSGEVGIRSLSALAGTAAIPVVYLATTALGTRRAGLIAASITATSPFLIWYSQEARNYELLVLLGALSFLCFIRALEEDGHRWLFSWGLVSALALTTHYFAIAGIVPMAILLLLRRPGRRLDTAFAAGAIVTTGIALLPLLAVQRGRGGWIDAYDLGGRLLQVPEHFLTGFVLPWPGLAPIAVVVVLAAVVFCIARADDRTPITLAFAVPLGGLAFLMVTVLIGDDYVIARNLLGLWPAFAAGVALAFAVPAAGRLGTAVTVALCAAGIGIAVWTAATPDAQRPDYRPLAERLEGVDGAPLIVSQTNFSSPLMLYVPGLHPATDEELTTSEVVVVDPRPLEDYSVGVCWWISTCGGGDTGSPPPFEVPAGFQEVERGSTGTFDYVVYRSEEPVTIERPASYFTPRVFAQPPD